MIAYPGELFRKFSPLAFINRRMPAAFRHENMTSSPLLLGELVAQHGQLGFRARDGLFIVFNASPGQTEGGLGFLDLLVDGAHIAREIAGVQRQRDYQFAQGFSHKVSL